MPWLQFRNAGGERYVSWGTIGTLPGVVILEVSGTHSAGTGHLVYDGSTLGWRAPGSVTTGTGVDVSVGGEFTLTDGDDTDQWVVVSVTPSWLPATYRCAAIQLFETYEGGLVGDDVTASEASSGDTSYPTTITITNGHTGTTDVSMWFSKDARGYFTLSPDGGSTWYSSTPASIEIGPDGTADVQIRRVVSAGATSAPDCLAVLSLTADDGSTEQSYQLHGLYRVFGASAYRFYRSTQRMPAPEHEATWDINASLPHTPADALSDDDYHLTVTNFNGVYESRATHCRNMRISGGDEITWPPSGPLLVWTKQLAGGVVQVGAVYPLTDPSAIRADTWQISIEGGSTYTQAMTTERGYALLEYNLPAEGDGTDLTINVSTKRSSDGITSPATPQDVSVTADGPVVPAGGDMYTHAISNMA